MDLLKSEITQKKRSDWCKALSYYSNEQKICKNCAILKNELSSFVLPIEKAEKKLQGINLNIFANSLIEVGKPLIFQDSAIKRAESYFIYTQQNASFSQIFHALALQELNNKPSATIISPDYYSKSKRGEETALVKEIQLYFDPTSFIKLPLDDMEELITYAASERCEMMLLPLNKLSEYLQLIKIHPKRKILPAAFYPTQL